MTKKATNLKRENIEYLKVVFSKSGKINRFFRLRKDVRNCLKEMRKFGSNQWWLSDEKKVIAYYQLQTKVLLVPVKDFVEALGILLGRSLYSHEIYGNWEAIKAEAEDVYVPYC